MAKHMFVFGSTPLAQYSDRLPITEEIPATKYALAISEPTSSEHGVTRSVHQRPFFFFMSTQPVMPPTTQRMTAMAKTAPVPPPPLPLPISCESLRLRMYGDQLAVADLLSCSSDWRV